MSLSQFAHNHHQQRTNTMYSTYADNTGALYPYYSSSASPVQDEYAAGEASYMNDAPRTHWQSQPTSSSSYSNSTTSSSSSHSTDPFYASGGSPFDAFAPGGPVSAGLAAGAGAGWASGVGDEKHGAEGTVEPLRMFAQHFAY